MKTSTLVRNEVSTEMVELVARLVDLISWPARRRAMGDVTLSLLDGKPRVAESVFGWSRAAVKTGITEFQTGVPFVNDLSTRRKPKMEDKYPGLLADIHEIADPHSQADPRLRTVLLYTNLTAQAVYEALLKEGWSVETLPTARTISNILNRQGYRLRAVAKTKVQKKPRTPKRSSRTSGG